MSDVYALSCALHPEDGVRYIGMSTRSAAERFKWHGYESKNARSKLPVYKWIRKHGLENVVCNVIEQTTPQKVQAAEIKWIAEYRARGANLMNMTDGGEGTPGYVRTEALRENSRQQQAGKRLGAANPFYGRKHTAATRAIMTASSTGRLHTADEKAKIAASHIRRKASGVNTYPGARGSSNGAAKITDADVLAIRARGAAGERGSTLPDG